MPSIPLTEEEEFQPQLFNYLGGFTRSAAEGLGELVGLDPSLATQKWREEHPIGGLISEFATPIGYYGAALKLGRIGKFGKTVERLGENYGPFLGGAVRETARIAPFELGRVGVSALVGDPERTALDALIGTAISGGVGAFGGALEAAGRRVAARWGSADPRAPVQVQGRELLKKLPELKDEMAISEARRKLKEWSYQIREGEAAGKGGKFLDKELTGGARPDDARSLNRLFKFNTKGPLREVRSLARSGRGLSSDAELLDVTTRARLPEGWEWYTKYPRYIKAYDKEGRSIARQALKGMHRISDDTFIAKEKEGLYLMARRLAPKPPPPGQKPAAEWVIFKTDEPAKFGTIAEEAWKARVENFSAWLNTAEQDTKKLLKGLDTVGFTAKFMDELPFRNALPAAANALEKSIATMGKMYGYGDKGELAEGFKRFAREYIAPADHRFRGNDLAQWIATNAKATFDYATAKSSKILLGERGIEQGKSLVRPVATGLSSRGGLQDLVNSLDEDDVYDVWRTWQRGKGVDAEDFAELRPRAQELIKYLDEVDERVRREVIATEKALGRPVTKFLKGHLGISHTWEGTWRQEVHEGAKLVYVGSGRDRATAIKRAENVVAQAKAEGKDWHLGGAPHAHEFEDDLKLLRRLAKDPESIDAAGRISIVVNKPSFFKPRKGIGGYVGESTPFTKDQLVESISGHTQGIQRYLARISTDYNLQKALAQLSQEDPKMHRQILEYIDDLSGVQGPTSRLINRAVDQALAPVLGKNSATQLVRHFNKFFYVTHLAAGNLAFPFMTLATFAQTVIPEMAFVAYGAPSKVSQYYWHALAGDTAGRPAKLLGILDAFKIQGQAVKLMRSPTPELTDMVNKASVEGILDPRLIEEYIGPSAKSHVTLKEAIRTGGIVKYLDQASNFLPESTERLSRLHAFNGAYLLGRDFLGLQGDRLYNFSKTFTNRTMYLYHTADRPKILQGPLGSAFGLFKNWQLNFLWNQLDYIGEATRGNFKPLLWGFTGSTLVGGLPAGGLLYWGADSMNRWMSDDSLMETFYGAFPRDPDGVNTSDALFLGLPAFLPTLAGIPGVSFAGQAATPLSDPTRDISQLMSFVYLDRVKYLGSAVGDAIAAWDSGLNPFQDPRFVGELSRAFSPKAIYRIQQSLSDGVLSSSSSGYPQVEIDPLEKALYIAGFNPTKVELAYRAYGEAYADQEAIKQRVSDIGAQWAAAQENRDYETIRQLMNRIIVEKLDMDSVMRSVRARSDKLRSDMFERSIASERLYQLQKAGLYQG